MGIGPVPAIAGSFRPPSGRKKLASGTVQSGLMPSPTPRNRSRDLTDPTRGERIQKVLSAAGIASRRACEELIEAGEVRVNGRIVRELPAFIDPQHDRITVSGEPIVLRQRLVYVLLYKPRNTVTTMSDDAGRRSVADLVSHPSGIRLYPVGRLDFDTMGLLLMTNDGELANRLTHPRYGISKTYRAIVKGQLEEEAVAALERGVYLADRRSGQTRGGVRTGEVAIRLVRRERERTILDITLREGRNREVRRILAAAGCPVKKLVRTEMGPLKLKGLRLGEWRELTSAEVRSLRSAVKGDAKSATGSRPRTAARSRPTPSNTKPKPARPDSKSGSGIRSGNAAGPSRSRATKSRTSLRKADSKPQSRTRPSKSSSAPIARPERSKPAQRKGRS